MDDKNLTKQAVQDVGPNLRWLFTSGTPGLSITGSWPSDITGQSEIAWGHIFKMLQNAGMAITDVVKITQYLTRSEDIPTYAAVRTRFARDARPASMLLVIPQLVRPEFWLKLRSLRRPIASAETTNSLRTEVGSRPLSARQRPGRYLRPWVRRTGKR